MTCFSPFSEKMPNSSITAINIISTQYKNEHDDDVDVSGDDEDTDNGDDVEADYDDANHHDGNRGDCGGDGGACGCS